MTILELYIDHFGKLKNRRIPLRAGTNVITGNNETGKSTIAAFIKAMLYGLSEGEEEYRHFFPRAYDGRFGGGMKVLSEGRYYEIRRELAGGRRGVSVRDLKTGRELPDPEGAILSLTGGIDRELFEESAFIRNESFPEDAMKYRLTREKEARAAHEDAVKADFRAAKKILEEKRKVFLADTDEELEIKKYRLNEEVTKVNEFLSGLDRRLPETENALVLGKSAIAAEEQAVGRKNAERERSLKEAVAQAEEKVEICRENLKKSATTTLSLGIVFAVLGVLVGIAAFVYIRFFGTGPDLADHTGLITGAVIGGVGALALIAGIVLLFVGGSKRRHVEDRLNERTDLLGDLDEKKKRLEEYLGNRAAFDDKILDEAKKRSEIETLSREANRLMLEKTETLGRAENLKKREDALRAAEEKDKNARTEIRAIDLAIATMDRIGNLLENEAADPFSEEATACYNGLLPERPATIEVKDEVVTVDFPETGKYLLSQLSTGTMHEVLIAVRLARLAEIDPGKHLPLILDDVFTNFDETRLNAAMEFLRATGRQSVLFSCQRRESIGGK